MITIPTIGTNLSFENHNLLKFNTLVIGNLSTIGGGQLSGGTLPVTPPGSGGFGLK